VLSRSELSAPYKIMISKTANERYVSLEEDIKLAHEQTGFENVAQGCKVQVTRRRTLGKTQSKQYGRGVHWFHAHLFTMCIYIYIYTWLVQALGIYSAEDSVITFLRHAMKSSKRTSSNTGCFLMIFTIMNSHCM